MTFKEMLNDDLDIFFNEDEFAESAEYRYEDAGTPATVTVIQDAQKNLETGNMGQKAVAVFALRRDQLTRRPLFKDTITVLEEKWMVEQVLGEDSVSYLVQARRDTRAILSKK